MLAAHALWLENKEQGMRANLSHSRLGGLNLQGATLSEVDLTGAVLDRADLRHARLDGAVLDCTSLTRAVLEGVNARGISLRGAKLQSANFTGAVLRLADLSDANLWNTEFRGADLSGAILRGARLKGTRLGGSRLTGATLAEAEFEPASVPSAGEVGGLIGLATLRIPEGDYSGAAQLRAALKASGLSDLVREVTYSIESWRTRKYASRSSAPFSTLWAGLRYVGFDVTTRYGLRPTRALHILATLAVLFAPVYAVTVWSRLPGGALVRLRPEKHLVYECDRFLSVPTASVQPLYTRNVITAFLWALYFSLLTACQMGFREVQPARWIRAFQLSDFELRPWGWVRVVAGAQSLLSLYLLVIWVLTQFGSIFE